MTTAVLEWDGDEYELKYTFGMIRRLRSEGINVPGIFRSVQSDPESAGDYGDDYAYVAAWLLREAGCKVTAEDVWRRCVDDRKAMTEVTRLFMWVITEHFAQSPNAPKPKKKTPARKATAKRKPRKTSR